MPSRCGHARWAMASASAKWSTRTSATRRATATSASSRTTSAHPPTSSPRRPMRPTRVEVDRRGLPTRIRIGDPDTTITGQHRYVLDVHAAGRATLVTGRSRSTSSATRRTFETGRFEVVLTGFDLTDPTCNVGPFGAWAGATLHVTATCTGRCSNRCRPGRASPSAATSTRSPRRPTCRSRPSRPARVAPVPLALGTLALGALAGVGGYPLPAELGRNEVGGAARRRRCVRRNDDGPARLVTDTDLDAMATTEFEPPRGIRPWHGAMLLTERSPPTRCRPGSPTRSRNVSSNCSADGADARARSEARPGAAGHQAAHRDAARRRRSTHARHLPAAPHHAVEGDHRRSRRCCPRVGLVEEGSRRARPSFPAGSVSRSC